MSEIGHAFVQPGVSRLDGRLGCGRGEGGGIDDTVTSSPRDGGTAGLAQGALLLETGDSGQTHWESPGDRRVTMA